MGPCTKIKEKIIMGFCKTDLCCTLKYEPTVSLC